MTWNANAHLEDVPPERRIDDCAFSTVPTAAPSNRHVEGTPRHFSMDDCRPLGATLQLVR